MEWSAAAGVSAAAGFVCLVLAALNWVVGKRWAPMTTTFLVLAGTAAIMGTPIGTFFRNIVIAVDGWLSQFAGQLTGMVLTGLIGIALIWALVLKLLKKDVDIKTLGLAAAGPVSVAVIPGWAGTAIAWIFGAIAWAITWPIAALLGFA